MKHKTMRMRRRPVRLPRAAESFRTETFPHIEAIYFDALCLTRDHDAASELVVLTYTQAYTKYLDFKKQLASAHMKASTTRNWLYKNMHSVFCTLVLCQAKSKAA